MLTLPRNCGGMPERWVKQKKTKKKNEAARKVVVWFWHNPPVPPHYEAEKNKVVHDTGYIALDLGWDLMVSR